MQASLFTLNAARANSSTSYPESLLLHDPSITMHKPFLKSTQASEILALLNSQWAYLTAQEYL
jgi:hypothetical protein